MALARHFQFILKNPKSCQMENCASFKTMVAAGRLSFNALACINALSWFQIFKYGSIQISELRYLSV